MKTNKTLRVYYGERLVGTLALTPEHRAAFAYGEDWLKEGFSISPFSLPMEKFLQVGVKAGMGKRQCEQIIEEVRNLVAEMLGGYLS